MSVFHPGAERALCPSPQYQPFSRACATGVEDLSRPGHCLPQTNGGQIRCQTEPKTRTFTRYAVHILHALSFLAYTLLPWITVCLHRACAYRYICGFAWIIDEKNQITPDLISLQLMVAGGAIYFYTHLLLQLQAITKLVQIRWFSTTLTAISLWSFLGWFLFASTVYGEMTMFTRNAHKFGSFVGSFLTWLFYTLLYQQVGSWVGMVCAWLSGLLLAMLGALTFGWIAFPPATLLLLLFLSRTRVSTMTRIATFVGLNVIALLVQAFTGCFPTICGDRDGTYGIFYLTLQFLLLCGMFVLGFLTIELSTV